MDKFPPSSQPPEDSGSSAWPVQPAPERPDSNGWLLLLGGVAGNLWIAALYFALSRFAKSNVIQGLGIPSIFLVPLTGGVVAAWFWRRLSLKVGACALHTLWMTALGVAGASIFFGEGVVCLVMASPLLYGAIFTGAALGRIFFSRDQSKLRVCLLPLLAMVSVTELATRADSPEVVVDEILIHAPPERVWPHVLAFPEIPEKPGYWIFRLGLPCPMSTTNGGDFVGAPRQCIFSDGIVLKETITAFVPRERLTFQIVEQPTHPEAYGHITLHRGQFDLRDNHDGTTTLIGSSWYTLHVRPLFYFDWWTRDMTRAVHLRVMEHVRQLSEKAG